jgi:dihydrodipicolinate synthase/N-acetylneuraminate lyase
MTKWTGVFPAVTTKLTQDGKVVLEQTKASIPSGGFLLSSGQHGRALNVKE